MTVPWSVRRSFKNWAEIDDIALERLNKDGFSIAEIALLLRRSENSISFRLENNNHKRTLELYRKAVEAGNTTIINGV